MPPAPLTSCILAARGQRDQQTTVGRTSGQRKGADRGGGGRDGGRVVCVSTGVGVELGTGGGEERQDRGLERAGDAETTERRTDRTDQHLLRR